MCDRLIARGSLPTPLRWNPASSSEAWRGRTLKKCFFFFTDCWRNIVTAISQHFPINVSGLSFSSSATDPTSASFFSFLGPLLQRFQMDRDRKESGKHKAGCSVSDVYKIHHSTVSLPGLRGVSHPASNLQTKSTGASSERRGEQTI